MKIKTDEKELLESQTFFAIGLGETVITFGNDQEKLKFILDFVQDDKDKKISIKWDVVDSKTLKVTLPNWNNPLGTALIEPVEVGTYRKRRLFILFFIKKAGDKGQLREVTFSTYLGEEVQVG